jgi:hypothetical protein
VKRIPLSPQVTEAARNALAHAEEFAAAHALEIGLAEIAAGAAVLALAVADGSALLGVHLVATKLPWIGVGTGSLATIATSCLGSIGVAAMGTAIGIPAAILTGGAGLLFGLAGVGLGSIGEKVIDPSAIELLNPAMRVTLGLFLILDGARRILGDDRFQKMKVAVTETYLEAREITRPVIAQTLEQLQQLKPADMIDAAGASTTAAVFAGAGAVAGSTLGVGSVTVLGSSGLGGVAVALGVVSAPLWPAVVGGAALGAAGYAAWFAVRKVAFRKHQETR